MSLFSKLHDLLIKSKHLELKQKETRCNLSNIKEQLSDIVTYENPCRVFVDANVSRVIVIVHDYPYNKYYVAEIERMDKYGEAIK